MSGAAPGARAAEPPVAEEGPGDCGALAIVVLLVFLRSVRASAVVATAIPVSVIGTIVGMKWTPGSSELGFSRFQFIAETGAFPDPPLFTPPAPAGASPTALDRAGRR